VGWVTTTFSEVKILPPPTGISLVLPSAEPPPDDEPPLDAEPLAAAEAPEPPEESLLPEPSELLLLLLPQAARVAANPARPIPARAPRRVGSMIGRES
jgi:hypothetical protein